MFEMEFTKGGLISDGVLTFECPIANKRQSRKFEYRISGYTVSFLVFLATNSNFLTMSDLAAFVCNWTKVKITSEVK